jgi:hypothetical protein
LESKGGVVEFKCDRDTRISEIYIQSHTSKKYLTIYVDLLIVDRAHSTNVNAMTLIPVAVVDAFGKCGIGIGGYILGHSQRT